MKRDRDRERERESTWSAVLPNMCLEFGLIGVLGRDLSKTLEPSLDTDTMIIAWYLCLTFCDRARVIFQVALL